MLHSGKGCKSLPDAPGGEEGRFRQKRRVKKKKKEAVRGFLSQKLNVGRGLDG